MEYTKVKKGECVIDVREHVRKLSSTREISHRNFRRLPSVEVPTIVELKHQISSLKHKINDGQMSTTDRKCAFVYGPTPELVLSMKQYIEKTYSMFHTDLDGEECWLHPSPPSPHQNWGSEGNIQHKFRWTDGDFDYVLNVNFGIVLLLVQNWLTEVQKQGYVTKGWRVNRVCGNWTCCNWHHFAMEEMEMLSGRRSCFRSSEPCRHSPPCLKSKIRHIPRQTQSRRPTRSLPATSVIEAAGSIQLPDRTLSARAIIERSTKARLPMSSSPTLSITAAESSSQLSNPTPLERDITKKATNPLSSTRSSPKISITRVENNPQFLSSHTPTRAGHNREHRSLLPQSPPPIRSTFGSVSTSQTLNPLPPRSPRTARSVSSNESSPRSPTHLPPRSPPTTQPASCKESSLHASNPPPHTIPTPTNGNPLKTPVNSNLPDPDDSPPNPSIASQARQIFQPAAQNLKSAFRAIGLWQNE